MLHLRPDGEHAERGVAPPVLRDFGDERTDHIEQEVWDECLRLTATGVEGAIRIAEELRRHPENDNAFLFRRGSPIMYRVYRNHAWTVVDKHTFMHARLGVAVAALSRYYHTQPDIQNEDMENGNRIVRRLIELNGYNSRSFKETVRGVHASFLPAAI